MMPRKIEAYPGLRYLLALACVVVIGLGMKEASAFLVPVLLAFFLAVLGYPVTLLLQRLRIPYAAGVALTVLFFIAILVATIFLTNTLTADFQNKIPGYAENLRQTIAKYSEDLEKLGVSGVREGLVDMFQVNRLFDWVGGFLLKMAEVLSSTVLVLLIMAFALLEARELPEKLRAILGRRPGTLERFRNAARDIQRYLGIKTLVSAVTGILAYLWVTLFGLDFPLLWALVAFVLNFIPTIGSILAAIPPVLLSLMTAGAGEALLVMSGYIAINTALGSIIEPALVGQRLGLSILAVVLSLLVWGWVLGPVGMFLAVPLTMAVRIGFRYTRDFRWVAILLAQKAPPLDSEGNPIPPEAEERMSRLVRPKN